MANNNPFNSTRYDLGVGDALGYDMDSATDNLLRSAYSTAHSCYICGNQPHAQVVPKKEKYNNAELQKGLFICNHCISVTPADNKYYGLRKLE